MARSSPISATPPPDPGAAEDSPCIQVCALDAATGWCLGCGRSIEEIAAWSTLPAERRRAVLDLLAERMRRLAER